MYDRGDNLVCPKCSGECGQESADIGIGIIYGPMGCYECGWSEDSYYDVSEGTSEAQLEDAPGRITDQFGMSHSKERLQEEHDQLEAEVAQMMSEWAAGVKKVPQ